VCGIAENQRWDRSTSGLNVSLQRGAQVWTFLCVNGILLFSFQWMFSKRNLQCCCLGSSGGGTMLWNVTWLWHSVARVVVVQRYQRNLLEVTGPPCMNHASGMQLHSEVSTDSSVPSDYTIEYSVIMCDMHTQYLMWTYGCDSFPKVWRGVVGVHYCSFYGYGHLVYWKITFPVGGRVWWWLSLVITDMKWYWQFTLPSGFWREGGGNTEVVLL
jgi:hypothetical protein